MFWKLFCFILLASLIVVSGFFIMHVKKDKACYDGHDVHQAYKAINELEKIKNEGKNIPEISDQELHKYSDDIQMARLEMVKVEGYDDFRFPRYPPATLKALYNSSFPIKGVNMSIPPGVYDRLYYWYPGFYTSGWSHFLRPMNKYGNQSFWMKNNGNYYYIRN